MPAPIKALVPKSLWPIPPKGVLHLGVGQLLKPCFSINNQRYEILKSIIFAAK